MVVRRPLQALIGSVKSDLVFVWNYLIMPMMNEPGMCKFMFTIGVGFLAWTTGMGLGPSMFFAVLGLGAVTVFTARRLHWDASATLKYVGFAAYVSAFVLMFIDTLTGPPPS